MTNFIDYFKRLLGKSPEKMTRCTTLSCPHQDAPVTRTGSTNTAASAIAMTVRSNVPKVKAPAKAAAKSTEVREVRPMVQVASPGYEDDSFSTLSTVLAIEAMSSSFDSSPSMPDFSGGGGDFGGGGASGGW